MAHQWAIGMLESMTVGRVVLNSASLPGSLLEELPMGVIVLDADGRVVLYNRAEQVLARRTEADVIGKDFFANVAPCLNVSALATVFNERIGRRELDEVVEASFAYPFSEAPRDVTVRMRSHRFEERPYAVLYLEDVSAERAITRAREMLAQMLVHDLRNPLTAIMANLGLLANGVPEGELAIAAESAMSASQRLRSMIANLLDISRLQTGTMPLDRQRRDAAELLARVADDARVVAGVRGVELVVEIGAEDLTGEYDEAIIRRALDNLVDNAIRHAPRGSAVTVRGVKQGAQLVIAVADEGPGVPDALRDRIFDAHVQAMPLDHASSHNVGLGLTFVRMAARAHGGSAALQQHDGRGSVFELSIPAA